MSSVVVLASGGFKSTVVACRARVEGDAHLLFADHGQPTAGDRRSAVDAIASHLGASLTVLDLPHSRRIAEAAGLSIDPSAASCAQHIAGGLSITLLSAGLQLAAMIDADEIHLGASEFAGESRDHALAHRRREYLYLANLMLEELQPPGKQVALKAPLVDMSGAEIVKLGLRFRAPFDLTFSCKSSSGEPCGECEGCAARKLAFESAQVADPFVQLAES